MVLMVGVDVHKGTHTAVITDELGRQETKKTVKATDAGHLSLLAWASSYTAARGDGEPVCRWAVEDCRHVSTRLERALLGAGQQVLRVPPKLMAGARASARTRGKSDPIDALAIARAALREPDLPTAQHEPASRELKLLVDHRENLVTERTQKINRLRWHLHELDPELDLPARGLSRRSRLRRLAEHLPEHHPGLVGELALELIGDITRLTERINALERELATRTATQAPQLLELDGCGALSAAKILAETANVTRFRSEAASPCTPESPRSPPRRAGPTATASLAAATGNSTPPCIASRGPRHVCPPVSATPTTYAASPAPTRTKTPSERSNDALPESSTTSYKPPPPPRHRAPNTRRLDIGATFARETGARPGPARPPTTPRPARACPARSCGASRRRRSGCPAPSSR